MLCAVWLIPSFPSTHIQSIQKPVAWVSLRLTQLTFEVTIVHNFSYNYVELNAEAADRHPDQESVKNDEEKEKEAKPVLVDANEMQRRFAALIDKVQPLLSTPDADPTELVSITEPPSELASISESATDTSVSECKAYLHLIDFDEKDELDRKISDPKSLFQLLRPCLNFQRFHILEMIVGQFKSEKAGKKMKKYHDLLNSYQSAVSVGRFVQAIKTQSPPENPHFMTKFSLYLESQWATCTVQDLENLLTRILPKSIGYTFVWFCKANQEPDNSICLDYVVSQSVWVILKTEVERKKNVLRSAGVLKIHIDGTDIRPEVGWLHASFLPRLLTGEKQPCYSLLCTCIAAIPLLSVRCTLLYVDPTRMWYPMQHMRTHV